MQAVCSLVVVEDGNCPRHVAESFAVLCAVVLAAGSSLPSICELWQAAGVRLVYTLLGMYVCMNDYIQVVSACLSAAFSE